MQGEGAVERWETLPEAPYVQVSDMGRVRTLGHFDARGTWREWMALAPSMKRKGYPGVNITYPDGTRRLVAVHRLVARLFVPNPDPDRLTEVDHLNADHADARAANLEWVTPEENKRRARALGVTRRRLTYEQVVTLHAMAGSSVDEAARAAGCSVAAALCVVRGWCHAGDESPWEHYGSYELDEAALRRAAWAHQHGTSLAKLAERYGTTPAALAKRIGRVLGQPSTKAWGLQS